MKTGVFKVSEKDYNQINALRSSDFKAFCESPELYNYRQKNKPGLMERSPQLAKGSLIHCMLLEPDKLKEDFVRSKFKTRRAQEFIRHAFALDKEGKTLLTAKEWDDCEAVAEAALKRQVVVEALNSGFPEISAIAKVEGVMCKIRMDLLNSEDGIITDLKTTGKPIKSFKYAIEDFGYDISAAFYLVVAEEAFKESKYAIPTEFRMLPIYKEPPYPCRLVALSDRRMEERKEFVRIKLREFSQCLQADVWQDTEDTDILIID